MATNADQMARFTKGTGLEWQGWLDYLSGQGAAELNHQQVVAIAVAKIAELGVAKNPDWWAQGVAIAYAQHLGKREPGQSVSGDYRASASKTVPVTGEQALAAWQEFVVQFGVEPGGLLSFNGVEAAGDPSESVTAKWFYWRLALSDGSRISVNIQTKPTAAAGERASVAIEQTKLAGGAEAIEVWKAYWRAVLTEFSAQL